MYVGVLVVGLGGGIVGHHWNWIDSLLNSSINPGDGVQSIRCERIDRISLVVLCAVFRARVYRYRVSVGGAFVHRMLHRFHTG